MTTSRRAASALWSFVGGADYDPNAIVVERYSELAVVEVVAASAREGRHV